MRDARGAGLVKSVIVVWDGAVAPNDFMMMQQGIVTCVESPEAETEVALPADGGDDACVVTPTARPT